MLNPRVILIFEACAAEFGVSVEDIRGRSRLGSIREARLVAMWILKRHLGFSYPQTARQFYGYRRTTEGVVAAPSKDHTTCIAGVKRVERMPHLLEAARQIAKGMPNVRTVGEYSNATGAREIDFPEAVGAE